MSPRSVFTIVIGLLMFVASSAALAQDRCPASRPNKLRVCHQAKGLQNVTPIEVGLKAYRGHAKHGDALAGTNRLDSDCQPDQDSDLIADLDDACPGDATNQCDPDGSAAQRIGQDGGTVATPDGTTALFFPLGALPDPPTAVSITDEDGGVTLLLTTTNGEAVSVLSFELLPDGLTFLTPAIMTLRWLDTNHDGLVDGANTDEHDLIVFKDGLPLTGR